MSDVRWTTKTFAELTAAELYALLRLRSEVFVVEQNCVFLDLDGKDQLAHHVIGYFPDGSVGATSRLFDRDVSYEGYSSIGRVCVSKAARRMGAGRALVDHSIAECQRLFGAQQPIKIGAQLYLERFYSGLGFVRSGDVYPDDGIDHVPMIRHERLE